MYDDDGTDVGASVCFMVFAVICLIVCGGIMYHNDDYYVTTSHEIWSVTAPFGVYYTDIDGSFVFGSGVVSSGLSEAYVVKYLVGGELKTISLDATSEYVHLIFANETHLLYIQEYIQDGLFGDVHCHSLDQYYIHIPEPVI